MLALEVDFIDRPPEPSDKAFVGIVDLAQDHRFEPLRETRAWNFQQGARLQWLPNELGKMIYNDRDGDQFVSVIVDTSSGKRSVFSSPIYAISPQGDFGLGVNFARLQNYGGYGYPVLDHYDDAHDPIPEDDGIFRVDFQTGKHELIISIADVARLESPLTLSKGEAHFLTHILFNPDGSRICFAHKRWLKDGGFHARLVTANPDGTELYCLPGEVSHFDWRNSTEILMFGRNRPAVAKLRQKNLFVHPPLRYVLIMARKTRSHLRQHLVGDRYLLLTDRTQNAKSIGVGTLTEDGHPSFSPDGKWVVTDTYPDKKHYRKLILYHWEAQRCIDVGRFYSLPASSYAASSNWDLSEMGSDLHPRWDRSGIQICIDSVHEGSRQLYVADVSEIVQSD